MKYVISGASAVLGRLVADELLTHIPASDLTLISRHTEALAKYSALGVNIFHGQHGEPEKRIGIAPSLLSTLYSIKKHP